MNELMREEIQDTPAAIVASLPALRAQARTVAERLRAGAGAERWIVTGSGDSWCAALALQYALRECFDADVHVATALDAARYWRYGPGDVVLAISQSGESARVLEAAQGASRAGANLFCITGQGGSTLATLGVASLVIPFQSRSRKTPHTTDYSTTLLALAALAEAVTGVSFTFLDDLATSAATAIAALEEPCLAVAQAAQDARSVYFVGAGPNYGTAMYGAAKLWEAGGVHAIALETEEFAHGPHWMVGAGEPVVLLGPSGSSAEQVERLAQALDGLGCIVVVVSDVRAGAGVRLHIPALPEPWSPLVASIPLQWLCHALATSRGYDVVRKDGLRENPEAYEALHWRMVRA